MMSDEVRPHVLAIDLDGTLLQYDGWKGPEHFGVLIEGMVKVLRQLREKGWKISIWTTRAADDALRAHLQRHDVPYDYINENPHGPTGSPKIFADVYLDDRALRFEGSTTGLTERIVASVPWFEERI